MKLGEVEPQTWFFVIRTTNVKTIGMGSVEHMDIEGSVRILWKSWKTSIGSIMTNWEEQEDLSSIKLSLILWLLGWMSILLEGVLTKGGYNISWLWVLRAIFFISLLQPSTFGSGPCDSSFVDLGSQQPCCCQSLFDSLQKRLNCAAAVKTEPHHVTHSFLQIQHADHCLGAIQVRWCCWSWPTKFDCCPQFKCVRGVKTGCSYLHPQCYPEGEREESYLGGCSRQKHHPAFGRSKRRWHWDGVSGSRWAFKWDS